MLFSFNRGTALQPNDDIPLTADAFTECFEENLLPNGAFCTKLGPQVSLFPVPIFGVNKNISGSLERGGGRGQHSRFREHNTSGYVQAHKQCLAWTCRSGDLRHRQQKRAAMFSLDTPKR
jgi:hypothetical protein